MYNHSDRFPFLAGAFFLAHYLPRSQSGNDALSSHLLRFKDNNESAVKDWGRLAAKSLKYSGINFKVIVRALGSSETTVNINTPLDHLGKKISREINAKYKPTLLSKSRRNKSLKYLNANERKNELSGLYSFRNYGAQRGDNILLIDDVVTTGTTLKSIYSAISQSCPQVNVYFFSLTKTFDQWQDENTNSEIYSQLKGFTKDQPSTFTPPYFYYEEPEPDWDLMEKIFQDTIDGHINPPGPNLRKGTKNGTWKPAEGFVWTKSNPNNIWEVKKEPPPGPNLRRGTKHGTWQPAEGYIWTKSNPNNDWEVKRLPPHIVETSKGYRPEKGYIWADKDKFIVIRKPPPGPNLRRENDTWYPAEGYVWTLNPENKWEVEKIAAPSSEWCFIATACSGSYDHPDVISLRQLRDRYLLKRKWGRCFVKLYYQFSPPVAAYISSRSTIRIFIRIMLIKPLAALASGYRNF